MQSLILKNLLTPFDKSTKEISFEPQKKIKRLNWFVKIAFSVFGNKWIVYHIAMIHHEIMDISRVKQNYEMYEEDRYFSKKNQNPITYM